MPCVYSGMPVIVVTTRHQNWVGLLVASLLWNLAWCCWFFLNLVTQLWILPPRLQMYGTACRRSCFLYVISMRRLSTIKSRTCSLPHLMAVLILGSCVRSGVMMKWAAGRPFSPLCYSECVSEEQLIKMGGWWIICKWGSYIFSLIHYSYLFQGTGHYQYPALRELILRETE